jgi:hypothetical protein
MYSTVTYIIKCLNNKIKLIEEDIQKAAKHPTATLAYRETFCVFQTTFSLKKLNEEHLSE